MSRRHHVDWMAPRTTTTHNPDFAPSIGGAPIILSATSYTQPAPSAPPSMTSVQLFGGVVLEQEEPHNEALSRPKKRSRASKVDSNESNEGSDEATKKKRGRPKVDGRDETAVDRRRTQIRLAQRAYRNRKESTIATLQHKVEAMQGKVSRMDSIFASLYDDLSGLDVLNGQSQARRQLELLRSEFTEFSSFMSSGDCVDGENSTKLSSSKEQPALDNSRGRCGHTSRGEKLSLDRLAEQLSRPSPNESVVGAVANGTQKHTQASASSPFYFDFDPIPGINKPLSSVDQWAQQGLNLERTYPLRASYTYSFQETSFARRLHRLCIETAFRNLGDPSIDPAWIAQIFHFALSYVDSAVLRAKFKALLHRGAGEPLESVETPFFHVGGAGTHFMRRDGSGKPIFPCNLQSPLQAPGPWKVLEDVEDVSNDTVQKLLGAIGYDGEWYDSREVEEYLKTKGIYLSGHESFVDIDPSKIGPPNAMSLPTIVDGRMTSPMTPLSSGNTYSLPHPNDNNVSFDAGPDRPFSTGKSAPVEPSPMYSWSGVNVMGHRNSMGSDVMQAFEQTLTPRPTVATLDIAKFLDRVVYGGACLGRAPGFRRAAIDQALALAVQESFQ